LIGVKYLNLIQGIRSILIKNNLDQHKFQP